MEKSTSETAKSTTKSTPAEELLKKIHELELDHAQLKHEISQLITTSTDEIMAADDRHHKQRAAAASLIRHSSPLRIGGGGGPGLINFTETQYLSILQYMGQSVYVIDLNRRIIYWNRSAEYLYGYTASEVLGRDLLELLTESRDLAAANHIMHRVATGESWTGKFPVKNKRGDTFSIIVTDTPFYDDIGTIVGVICVAADARTFQKAEEIMSGPSRLENESSFSRDMNFDSAKLGLDPQQPLQSAITSKISNLASKVKSKMRPTENYSEHRGDAASSGASMPRGDILPTPFGVFTGGTHDEYAPGKPSRYSGDESDWKPGISRILSSNAEAWIGKKGLLWPWKGNEHDGTENEVGRQKSGLRSENNQVGFETNRTDYNEASSVDANSTSSASSCGSTSSSAENKDDVYNDCLDYEILWEDLTIREKVGQGSCGTVYHALWCGSDVAVKVFSKQEYSDDVIFSFRHEVSLMKKLRHPNILLFMGAVTSPQRLCIVTEFLPRGSLFQLLRRTTSKLEWRRRIHMALDIVSAG